MAEALNPRTHPAFADFDQVLPLSGFSGAAIALVKRGGSTQTVRKAAGSPDLNQALMKQALRQTWLRDRLDGAALVPEVLCDGEVDGLYFFEMAFVPSRDANAYLTTVPFHELEDFAASIERLMERLSTLALPDSHRPPDLAPLRSKLTEISARTSHRVDDLLQPLELTINRLASFADKNSATVTHGDLTFENILISARHDLWLIDPIESPIDHYWFDWAKLFQDCEGRWHLHRGKRLPLNVVRWLRHRWLDAAVRLSPDYASRHYLLLALTFARILPYARSERDLDFVRERVRAFGQAALDHV